MTLLRSKLEQNLGRFTLGLLLLGCLWVMLPFLVSLLWAVVLSYSLWPLYRRLVQWLGGRRTVAAVLLTLGMIGLLLLPFVLVGATLADNVSQLTAATRRWLDAGPPAPPGWLAKIPLVGSIAVDTWQTLAGDSAKLLQEAKRFIEPVSSWALKAGLKLGSGLVQLALSILVTFLLLCNGPSIGDRLTSVVRRIGGERGYHLLSVAGNTVRGVVYGILGTALLQAALAGVGFFIAGVPGPGLLALLIFPLSVVPAGPFLVMLPAAFWLWQQGATGWGIFMIIWSVIVSTVDNFVKPWLISQGSAMPFILIFFGVIGGALAFGFIGVFIGPTLLAVGYRLVEEWVSNGLREDSLPTPARDTAVSG
jgi:predicted PurR-regulated permease PerM